MAVKTVQVIVNGQTYTLNYNATSKKYEATVTAPNTSSYNNNSEHYFPVQVRAEDVAGNATTKDEKDATLGSSLKLRVKEKVAPTIEVVSPSTGATIGNNKPTFQWKVLDDDSGVDESTISIKIDNGAAVSAGITKTPISGGFSCSYTPDNALSDSNHTIVFNASDHDGNAAMAVTITVKVDTVPPSMVLNSPTDGLVTNGGTIQVSGETNDDSGSPVEVLVNGTPVTVNGDGTFSTTVDLTEGENTITVTAKDAAGKTTTITRTVTLDTVPPVITDVALTPNPVDCGMTYIISVSVQDP